MRELIPDAGIEHRPGGDGEITLLDLATHRSSLRTIDFSFKPEDPENPLAGYTKERLYIHLRARGLRKSRPTSDSGTATSGSGCSGTRLRRAPRVDYVPLVKKRIIDALSMHDTVYTLNDEQKRRFMQPYRVGNGRRHRVKAYDVDVLAGAAGLRTTVGDMLVWAEANLHPDDSRRALARDAPPWPWHSWTRTSHARRWERNGRIGLAWFIDPATGRLLSRRREQRHHRRSVVQSARGYGARRVVEYRTGQRLLRQYPRRLHPRATGRNRTDRARRHDDSRHGRRPAPRCGSPPRGGSR